MVSFSLPGIRLVFETGTSGLTSNSTWFLVIRCVRDRADDSRVAPVGLLARCLTWHQKTRCPAGTMT